MSYRVKRKPPPAWDMDFSSNKAQSLRTFVRSTTPDTYASDDELCDLKTRPNPYLSAPGRRPQTAPANKSTWYGGSSIHSTDDPVIPTLMTDSASVATSEAELRTPSDDHRQLPSDSPSLTQPDAFRQLPASGPSTTSSDPYRQLAVDPPCIMASDSKAALPRMPSSISISGSRITDFSSPRKSTQISPTPCPAPKRSASVLRKSNSTRGNHPKAVAFDLPTTPTDDVGVLEKASTPNHASACPHFDANILPTTAQLQHAASLFVIAENGIRVPFGALWNNRRTIVIFLRHFMCPLCQDYMASISRNLAPSVLYENNLQMVFIGNGSHELISSYRAIFGTPFQMYTDPNHAVYEAMGMDRRTTEAGPGGSYVRHGLISGIGMVVRNALRVRMPIYKKKGDIAQLGGEFVLGPGLECSLAHRMEFTQSHMPILDVVRAAGVDMQADVEVVHDDESVYARRNQEKEALWVDQRIQELLRIQHKRLSRRCGPVTCGVTEEEEDTVLDTVLDISAEYQDEPHDEIHGGHKESFWDDSSESEHAMPTKVKA